MNFSGEPLREGRGLVRHVKDLKEIIYSDKSVISANCHKSMKFKEIYEVTFHVNSDRTVTLATCTCLCGKGLPKGKGEYCKHGSAVYDAINEWKGVSKTSKKMEWNKPSEKQDSLYDKTKTFKEMFGSRFVKRDPKKPNLEKMELLKSLIEQEGHTSCQLYKMMTSVPRAESPPSSPPPAVPVYAIPDVVKSKLLEPLLFMPPRSEYLEFYTSMDNLLTAQDLIRDFYKQCVAVDSKKALLIFIDSIEQSESKGWKVERKPRFNSSTAYAIYAALTADTAWNHWKRHVPNLRNLRYGRLMEKIAIDVLMILLPRSYIFHKSGSVCVH